MVGFLPLIRLWETGIQAGHGDGRMSQIGRGSDEVYAHAYKYANEQANAIHSVCGAYARHYCAITECELETTYWPSHKDEFWRWIKHQPISDWRN